MSDLTPETLAKWRKDAETFCAQFGRPQGLASHRILALLDALAAEKARAEFEHDDHCEAEYEPGAHAWTPCGCWASRAEAEGLLARAEQAEDRATAEFARAEFAVADAKHWQHHAEEDANLTEAALSRVLGDIEGLGMRDDGITDTDGGKWIPCADVLALVAEHRDRT